MDETKLAKCLLISVFSLLVFAFMLSMNEMNTPNADNALTRDIACFSA